MTFYNLFFDYFFKILGVKKLAGVSGYTLLEMLWGKTYILLNSCHFHSKTILFNKLNIFVINADIGVPTYFIIHFVI